MTDEGEYHLASADAHNLQRVVGRRNRDQVEVVDQAVASSVGVVDAVPVLGEEVVPLQDGAEPLDQGLVGKLDGG